MKATGMVRNLDELGRVVIPKEIRKKLKISQKDPIEIFIDKNGIVLKKLESVCTFCNSSEELIRYRDKMLCKRCFEDLLESKLEN